SPPPQRHCTTRRWNAHSMRPSVVSWPKAAQVKHVPRSNSASATASLMGVCCSAASVSSIRIFLSLPRWLHFVLATEKILPALASQHHSTLLRDNHDPKNNDSRTDRSKAGRGSSQTDARRRD